MTSVGEPSSDNERDLTVEARIAEVIGEIKPFIQQDGGDIEFVAFTDQGIAHVRLRGACVGCPGAIMTLRFGVEARLKQRVPEVRGVACVP